MGWQTLRGDWSESNEISFLVKEATAYLNDELLQLTTIADTPGLGSPNTRHDDLTAQYLDNTMGCIFMIPSNKPANFQFRASLTSLCRALDEAERRFQSNGRKERLTPESVLFVINYFEKGSGNPAARLKELKETIITEILKELKQFPALQNREAVETLVQRNLFVVQLKWLNEGKPQEELHGYHSATHLIERLRTIFRAGQGYSRMFDVIAYNLSDKWQEPILALQMEKDHLSQGINNYQQRATAYANFLAYLLPARRQQALADLHAAWAKVEERQKDVESSLSALARASTGYDRDDFVASTYLSAIHWEAVSFNDAIDAMANAQFFEQFIADINADFKSIGESAPSLSVDRFFRRRVTVDAIDSTIADAKKNWPNLFQRGVNRAARGLKEFFNGTKSEDQRLSIVKSIKDEWSKQLRDVNNAQEDGSKADIYASLQRWLTQSSDLLEESVQAKQRENEAKRNVSAQQQIDVIDARLAEMASYEATRINLLQKINEIGDSIS